MYIYKNILSSLLRKILVLKNIIKISYIKFTEGIG